MPAGAGLISLPGTGNKARAAISFHAYRFISTILSGRIWACEKPGNARFASADNACAILEASKVSDNPQSIRIRFYGLPGHRRAQEGRQFPVMHST